MGCNFYLVNETRGGVESADVKDFRFYRNITDFGVQHLRNLVAWYIRENGWDAADNIRIKCDCHPDYLYRAGRIYAWEQEMLEIGDDEEFDVAGCVMADCPVCGGGGGD